MDQQIGQPEVYRGLSLLDYLEGVALEYGLPAGLWKTRHDAGEAVISSLNSSAKHEELYKFIKLNPTATIGELLALVQRCASSLPRWAYNMLHPQQQNRQRQRPADKQPTTPSKLSSESTSDIKPEPPSITRQQSSNSNSPLKRTAVDHTTETDDDSSYEEFQPLMQ